MQSAECRTESLERFLDVNGLEGATHTGQLILDELILFAPGPQIVEESSSA